MLLCQSVLARPMALRWIASRGRSSCLAGVPSRAPSQPPRREGSLTHARVSVQTKGLSTKPLHRATAGLPLRFAVTECARIVETPELVAAFYFFFFFFFFPSPTPGERVVVPCCASSFLRVRPHRIFQPVRNALRPYPSPSSCRRIHHSFSGPC